LWPGADVMAGDGRRPGPVRPAGKPRRLPQVKTLEKAMRVLAFLASEQRECGVHEVARGVGQHPSTAYRLLAVLTRHGLVRHGSVSGRYSLGLRLAELGHAALTNLELRATARPYLEEVMAQTRETVHLMMLDGDFGIYVDRVEGPQRVRVASSVGYREYLHCSAVGKAILAHLAAERVAEIVAKGLPRLTPRTITDYKRYGGAIMRPVSVGKPADDTKRRAEVMVNALSAIIEAIRPGVASGAVDQAGRRIVEEAGLGKYWLHRTGYSIGVGFPPGWGEGHIFDLKPGDERKLESGMTFHLVPNLLIPGEGAMGFSETVLVTRNGCEVLTKIPRRLLVV
jgi:IclR family KDG regulon transcriptional repressor